MLLRIAAIAGLVIFGFALGGGSLKSEPLPVPPFSFGVLAGIGSAMVPVAFAYGGWQTATFVAGEMHDARRDLSRGLLMGVAGVWPFTLPSISCACAYSVQLAWMQRRLLRLM